MDGKFTRDAVIKSHRADWLRREQILNENLEHPEKLSDAELCKAQKEIDDLGKQRGAAGMPTRTVGEIGANAVLREAEPTTQQEVDEQNERRMQRWPNHQERVDAENERRQAEKEREEKKKRNRSGRLLKSTIQLAWRETPDAPLLEIGARTDQILAGKFIKFRAECPRTWLKIKNSPTSLAQALNNKALHNRVAKYISAARHYHLTNKPAN
jgi:hypothetical protein